MNKWFISGDIVDIDTSRRTKVRGHFQITDKWWQTIILRTKKNKDQVIEPKDFNAICYKLRSDAKCVEENHVHMLLTNISNKYDQKNAEELPWIVSKVEEFYTFLKYGLLFFLNTLYNTNNNNTTCTVGFLIKCTVLKHL